MRFIALLLFSLTLLGVHGCKNKVEELPDPDFIATYVASLHEIPTDGEAPVNVNLVKELSLKPGMRLVLGQPRHGTFTYNDITGQFTYQHKPVQNFGAASRVLPQDSISYKVCQKERCSDSSYIRFRVTTADSCRLLDITRDTTVAPGQKLTFYYNNIGVFCPGTQFDANIGGSDLPPINNTINSAIEITLPPLDERTYIINIGTRKPNGQTAKIQFRITTRRSDSYCRDYFTPRTDTVYFKQPATGPVQPTRFSIRDSLFRNDDHCPNFGGDPRSFRIRRQSYRPVTIDQSNPDIYHYSPGSGQRLIHRDSLQYEIKSALGGSPKSVKLLFLRKL